VFVSIVLALVFPLLFAGSSAYAQSTFASITGTVTDTSGAIVPNTRIVVTNQATGIQSSAQSNAAGIYAVPQLNPGSYSLRAQANGFEEFLVSDIVLDARDLREINVTLRVGKATTQVTVTGGATLINAETDRINQTISADELDQLPLDTSSIWPFLSLQPGVLQNANSSTLMISGSRGGQDNWSIDGTTFSDGVDNTQIGPLANYSEAFSSMETSLANNSAEFGALGQITLITKSGTNHVHGDVFDRYTSSAFLSRDAFATTGPSFVQHVLGGSVGGPVFIPKVYDGRDKTFFFFAYEAYTGSSTLTIFDNTVPTAAMRQGDFSSFLPAVQIYDPNTGQPFSGNVIPSGRINSVSKALQNTFYPLPNNGNTSVFQAQNYLDSVSYPYLMDDFVNFRLDEKVSDKDSFFARVSWQHNPWEGGMAIPTIGPSIEPRNDDADSLSYTHLFSPHIFNEFRFGFNFNNGPESGIINGAQLASSLGLEGLAPNLPNLFGMPELSFTGTGITPITFYPYADPGYLNRTYQIQDNVSWLHGKHSMKFGLDIGHVDFNNYELPADEFGNLTFAPTYTSGGITGEGNAYADFMLGIPTSMTRSYPPVEQEAYRWFYNFFAEDEYKVTHRLTLNFGVRYQVTPFWSEHHDYIADFDTKTGEIVVPDGGLSKVSSLVPTSYVGVESASSAGLPQNLMYTAKHNFGPRIGVAYTPWGTQTVFRAGFGVFYNAVNYPWYSYGNTVPFVIEQPAYTNTTPAPTVVLPQVFPTTGVGGPSTISLPAAMNTHLPTPYSLQYNFTIERQQWNTGFRISYVGTGDRQDTFSYNTNSPMPNALPYVDKVSTIPFPNYPGVYYTTNGASHQYNGLTLNAHRATKGGLFYQASYTWARDTGNYDWDGVLTGPEDPFNFRRDYGPEQSYPLDRFTGALMYQLPFGQGRHWLSGASKALNEAVGGWQISPILTVQTGQFLTPEWCGSDPTGTAYTTSSTPAEVCIRPDVNGNPNSGGLHTPAQWFNSGVYSPPQLGNFGTAGVGTIKGPGLAVVDFAVMKEFYLHGGENGLRLQVQLQGTNIFNRVNWSNPDNYLSDGPAFGTISSDGGVNGRSTGDLAGAKTFLGVLKILW
jgi:hypothetical protein